MNTVECIAYINQHINKQDEFIQSVLKQYDEKEFLTRSQLNALRKTIDRHQKIAKFFREVELENNFEKSLKTFFETNGFLTPKQMKSLGL